MTNTDMPEDSNSSADLQRIGFGCSNLLGNKTREGGMALLHAAFESGIRHFDVARVYNFGDAEALVGEFAAGRRHEVTITTKFGLAPRANVAKFKGPIAAVRSLMRSSPLIRKLVRRNVKALTQAARFDSANAQDSLETSLRTLRTDHVDMYLMHEATKADCTDEILAFLHKAQSEGKILAFGCGTGYRNIPAIAQERPQFLQIAQFESSLLQPNIQTFLELRPPETQQVVTHGANAVGATIASYLASDPVLLHAWSDAVGFDLSHGPNLYALLLKHALHENPGGLALYRTSTPDRIRETAVALERLTFGSKQAEVLRTLVASVPKIDPA